jgi:hypothetical protein
MSGRKRTTARRTPDLTLEIQGLVEFTDKPRGDPVRKPLGKVVTSYDPAVNAVTERMKQKAPLQPRNGLGQNGHSGADELRIQNVMRLLQECLQSALSIKSKRATELVKLLRVACNQLELVDAKHL